MIAHLCVFLKASFVSECKRNAHLLCIQDAICMLSRLQVALNFPSGIVERAKHEHVRKSPSEERQDVAG